MAQIKGPEADCAVERERLHKAAAAVRSGTEKKSTIPGGAQREILLAPALLTNLFLHMDFAFMWKPDNWQAIRAEKCKKNSIPR